MKRKSATGRSSTCIKSTGYPVVVKHIILYKATAFLAVLFIFSSGINKDTIDTPKPSDFYNFNKIRVSADWEPAKGLIFMCPPVIPKELIIEFDRDTHLYPVGHENHGLYNFYDNIVKNEPAYTNSRFFPVHHVNP